MLDVAKVDLSLLATAMEDQSPESAWWLDPITGEAEYHGVDGDDPEELEARGMVVVEPTPSSEAYADMEDFTARVRDPRARDLLGRAIEGRGAFRRFKDTLLDFPELRRLWFAFHDARAERRALRWLADESRNTADYRWNETPALGAADAVEQAEALVAAVSDWIAARS